MTLVTDQKLAKMLDTIRDPKLKRQIASIANGVIQKSVICNKCKVVIGNIYEDGRVEPTETKDGMKLMGYRQRLDGFMGFQCICGNDSRLSSHEKGHIGTAAPSKTELEKIWDKLQKSPSKYPAVGNKQKIDGFTIEEIN